MNANILALWILQLSEIDPKGDCGLNHETGKHFRSGL